MSFSEVIRPHMKKSEVRAISAGVYRFFMGADIGQDRMR
jgi:hypothetical protein